MIRKLSSVLLKEAVVNVKRTLFCKLVVCVCVCVLIHLSALMCVQNCVKLLF